MQTSTTKEEENLEIIIDVTQKEDKAVVHNDTTINNNNEEEQQQLNKTNSFAYSIVNTASIEMLNNLLIQPSGYSILNLSQKHRLLLVFIKWKGCPLCQKVMEDLSNCLPNFLKLNVIPVIVHQEDEDKLVTFLKEKNLQSLKVSKEDLINFGIEDASFGHHVKMAGAIVRTMVMERRGVGLPSLREMKTMNLLSSFGMLMIEDGVVMSDACYVYKLWVRPDYGKLIVKLRNNLKANSNPEDFVSNLLLLYPNLKEMMMKARDPNQSGLFTVFNSNYEEGTIIKNNTSEETSTATSPSPYNQQAIMEYQKVMGNNMLRNYFKAFLINRFCVELLLFIEQVELFKALSKSQSKIISLTTSSSTTSANTTTTNNNNNLTLLTIEEEGEEENEEGQKEEQKEKSTTENDVTIEIEKKVNDIVTNFLTEDAMFEININKKTIATVLENIRNVRERNTEINETTTTYSSTLFDEIVIDIETKMLQGIFIREFINSNLYNEMKQNK
ncbi:hypothetical protein ABK040_016013 [Willaertia magna]